MEQGFDIKFYGKVQYLKRYDKLIRFQISAFHYGYVNVQSVAFKDVMGLMNNINDKDYVRGSGKLSSNEFQGKTYLQLVVDDIQLADEPEYKGKKGNGERKQKPNNQNQQVDDNDYSDLEDDLPF